jgi:hypothetical protein
MNARLILVVLQTAAPWLLACRASETSCPATLRNAISLAVVDSLTSMPPSARSTVLAINGSYSETITTPTGDSTNNVYDVGFGRSGAFALEVVTSGYAVWTETVSVSADACGSPHSLAVVARLQR